MCGIVGYIGHRDAFDILVKGLHRLEYRGYDSSGVALVNGADELHVYKAKGKASASATSAPWAMAPVATPAMASASG